jgi:hypothetical protein
MTDLKYINFQGLSHEMDLAFIDMTFLGDPMILYCKKCISRD